MSKDQKCAILNIIKITNQLKDAFYQAGAAFKHVGPEVARLDQLESQLEREIELDSLVTDLEHLIKYGAK